MEKNPHLFKSGSDSSSSFKKQAESPKFSFADVIIQPSPKKQPRSRKTEDLSLFT